MKVREHIPKAVFFICAFFIMGCEPQGKWAIREIKTGDKHFDSKKYVYQIKDPLNEIDLELIQMSEDIKGYLNVHAFTMTPSASDPKKVHAQICYAEKTFSFLATLLEGNQKAIIERGDLDKILEIFKVYPQVTLEVEGFKTEVISPKFQ